MTLGLCSWKFAGPSMKLITHIRRVSRLRLCRSLPMRPMCYFMVCSAQLQLKSLETLRNVLIRSNKMQQYAGIYWLQVYSTCFGRPSRPSSGVQKTVTAASGTGHSNGATTFLQRRLPSRPSSGVQKTVTAVSGTGRSNGATTCTRGYGYSFYTPDDGGDGRPKHVE